MKRIWILSLVALCCLACGDGSDGGVPCSVNADCQSHELCYDGHCVAVQCPEPPEVYKGYSILDSLCDYQVKEGNSEMICCPYTKDDCSYILCCDKNDPQDGYVADNLQCF